MDSAPSPDSLFNSGMELANIVVNSDLIQLSWTEIYTLYKEVNPHQLQPLPVSLRWRESTQQGCVFVSFVTFPICTRYHLQYEGDMVSSASLKQENFLYFESLCSKGNPSFSIHRAAILLFRSHFNELLKLKDQLLALSTNVSSAPLIITGHSLGGSIATLFTLWLLDSSDPKAKRLPLCITYGSPFVGDKGLKRAVSERSRWNSCFLHIFGSQDPIPNFLLSSQNAKMSQPGVYKPFGTFLFCSELGCSCVEDPDSVALIAMSLESTRSPFFNEELLVNYYRDIVQKLNSMFILRRNSQLGLSAVNPSQAGIILQLEAIGIKMTQQQEQDIKILVTELERPEFSRMLNRRNAMNPMRKLNQTKIKMAYLEWYKKDCKAKETGYYDSYKNKSFSRDMDVTKHKKFLTKYWEDMVEEAARKPQKETMFIRDTWLFAGTNYRRMVEPLDIGEYYRVSGNRDYQNRGRSRHYVLLEQWLKEDGQKPAGSPANKRKNVAGNLTEDSCFWANVEEARILCKILNDATCSAVEKQPVLEGLCKFEQYVTDQINNSAVSPEIFLKQSSFMTWYEEYKICKPFYNSPLMNFMKNGGHNRYTDGKF